MNRLQEKITRAIKKGHHKISINGTFTSEGVNQFSLLVINHDIEIDGNGKTTFDGTNSISHLVFIKDGIKVRISGVKFINGNTAHIPSQLSLENHPFKKLNVFRYLDGGAISLGEGSELILENCIFESNHSSICGGAISNLGGYLHVKGCTFKKNTCGDTGAAIDNLAVGSLTVVEKCRFITNKANLLGKGTFGGVTAFPNTYLVVKDSDFSSESYPAIDYQLNKRGKSFICIDKKNTFNESYHNPIVKNPKSNIRARKDILILYIRLLMTHPGLVKLERIPTIDKSISDKYKKIFEECISEYNSKSIIKNMMTSKNPLTIIPGIGRSIAEDLNNIGIYKVEDLVGKNAEELFEKSNKLVGTVQDRCLLYTFRCAIYYSEGGRDSEKLKWWNWKD